MRKIFYSLFFILLTHFFYGTAYSAEMIGYVENVLGQVKIMADRKSADAKIGKEIFANDFIVTRQKSVIKIKFIDDI